MKTPNCHDNGWILIECGNIWVTIFEMCQLSFVSQRSQGFQCPEELLAPHLNLLPHPGGPQNPHAHLEHINPQFHTPLPARPVPKTFSHFKSHQKNSNPSHHTEAPHSPRQASVPWHPPWKLPAYQLFPQKCICYSKKARFWGGKMTK